MPILAKIMHSWCVESEKWVENFFHRWTSEKIPFLYFFLHKSWIWQTLGHVTKIFSYHHFHNASKECFWPKIFLNFMHGFKSAILAKMKNCQNGTFEPVHGIQNFLGPKDFFWSVMKMTFTKNIPNMSQGPPNPGFRYLNLENWDFLKKDSQDFKNSFQFGFLSISKIRWCFLIFIIF